MVLSNCYSAVKFSVYILGFERQREWWAWYSVESIWWEQRGRPNWIITPSQWHSRRNGISFWQTRKIILHVLWKRDLWVILWTIIIILVCQPNLYPFIYIRASLWCCSWDSCWRAVRVSWWFTEYTEIHTMACSIIGILCSLVLNRQEPKAVFLADKDFWGKVQWVYMWL